jgi:Spy/CpxP family protein refolding chaperone
MAFCSIALAFGVVGLAAIARRLAWRHRMVHACGPFAAASYGGCGPWGGHSGGGPFAFGPFGHGGPFGGHFGGPFGGHFGGPFGHGMGHGGPWGWHGGGFDRGPRGWHGWRRMKNGFVLGAILERLEVTHAQEREIRDAVDDFKKVAREAKEAMASAREGVARAIEGEVFDEIAMGDASVKIDATKAQVKEAFETALRRVHAVLDPKQREILAEMIAKGPRGLGLRGWGGPYRGEG